MMSIINLFVSKQLTHKLNRRAKLFLTRQHPIEVDYPSHSAYPGLDGKVEPRPKNGWVFLFCCNCEPLARLVYAALTSRSWG